MSTSTMILPHEFDINRISYGQLKVLNTGGKMIYVNYAGEPLIMQTPKMKAPFGVGFWPSENGGPDKYSIDLSFDGYTAEGPVKMYYDAISSIDKRVKRDAFDNALSWFKKTFATSDVIEHLFSPAVRVGKPEYAPTMKLTLPHKDGVFSVKTFNANTRLPVEPSDVIKAGACKGATVQAIIQLSGIWIVGTKFGCTWKVKQLNIRERQGVVGFAFKPMPGEGDDASEQGHGEEDDCYDDKVPPSSDASKPPSARASRASASAGVVIDSSEDDLDA